MQSEKFYPLDQKAGGYRIRPPVKINARKALRFGSRGHLCIHVRNGRVDAPRYCALNFECYHCGFDQILDELDFGAASIAKTTGGYLS